jgi:hypothetical protein
VVDVAFRGSWFCSSLISKERKSVDVIVELDEDAVDDDVLVVAVETELVADTVIRNSGLSARLLRCETTRA